jgi:hypothetical protein
VRRSRARVYIDLVQIYPDLVVVGLGVFGGDSRERLNGLWGKGTLGCVVWRRWRIMCGGERERGRGLRLEEEDLEVLQGALVALVPEVVIPLVQLDSALWSG